MSDDGTRLVASLAKGGQKQILAFELDPQTNEWTSQVVASRTENTFANPMSISGDGTTIVAGSPGLSAADGTYDIGLVEVFRVQPGGEWAQSGQSLTNNEKFGRDGFWVSVSRNGDTIATGTPFAGDDDVGRVEVYQFKSAYDC